MRFLNGRHLGVLGVVTTLAALAAALWWQYHDGLEPCSLCWVQRGEVVLLLIGFALHWRWQRLGSGLALLAAVAGLVTALLQLDEVQNGAAAALNVCTITASGLPSCAVAGAHRILGIRLVDWSLAGFVFWLLLALAALPWRARGAAA